MDGFMPEFKECEFCRACNQGNSFLNSLATYLSLFMPYVDLQSFLEHPLVDLVHLMVHVQWRHPLMARDIGNRLANYNFIVLEDPV